MNTVILLHGAIGASSQLQSLADILKLQYDVHTLDFSGHGAVAAAGSFSIEIFAKDVLKYIDSHKLEKVSIFGYSMGGYVGMYLALHHPERIEKLVTLATKYQWDAATAEKECAMLDADKIAAKLPAFAETLNTRHTTLNWKQVLYETQGLLRQLGADSALKPGDYPNISRPILVLLGDRDKMVTLDETVAVYRSLPNAQLGVLPAMPHPIEQVDASVLSGFISRFLG